MALGAQPRDALHHRPRPWAPLARRPATAQLVALDYDWRAYAASMRDVRLPEAFIQAVETRWWTTCLEIVPPAERSRGRSSCTSSVSTRSGFAADTKPAPATGACSRRSPRSAGQQEELSGGAAALQVLVGTASVGERVPAADGDPQ